MADKKTTTKVIKSKAKDSDKSVKELREDLLMAQKSLYDGTLTNPHAIKSIKKQIARKLTAEKVSQKEAKQGAK